MILYAYANSKSLDQPAHSRSLIRAFVVCIYQGWTVRNLRHEQSGAPGLVDRVFAIHAGSRGFDSHRRHMSERFFRSNRPQYPHPVCSGLENSGIRVAVGDCSVTERRRWRPPYQTGKTAHVCANTLQT